MLKFLKKFKAFLVILFDNEHNIHQENKWKLNLVFVLFSYFHFIIIVIQIVKTRSDARETTGAKGLWSFSQKFL